MKLRFSILALAGLLGLGWKPLSAQQLNPVRWSAEAEPVRVAPGSRTTIRVTARLDPGWHLYSLAVPEPIIPTSITLAENPAVESFQIYQPQAATAFDPNFGFEVATYENEAVFLLDVRIAKDAPPGAVELSAGARYQTCNNKMCLPPRRVTAPVTITIDPKAEAAQFVPAAGYTLFDPAAPRPQAPAAAETASTETAAAVPVEMAASSQGLILFMLVAFGVGVAAIFTPCVFPMIPITVSYFLNKPEAGRGRGVFDAVVFCLGIIVLFTALGAAATAALGPFGMVQLGSNVWVNTFIALVFLVFALSLLGAFEITIPSSILTRLDRASQGGGVAGTLLMGLTFSLTAFACVGPFVGTLLAASVSSGGARPLAGMVSFATGLATPFFFLAAFPSYLKRLPRSGGWLERVKVVMGFLILAAMLKYLSSVDQVMQWNVITRERFLAVWIVLFALPGLYLLGFLRMHGIKPDEPLGLGRLLTGAALVTFAISLVPGMLGGHLGELEAYVPPPAAGRSGEIAWLKNQYGEALARARAGNKLVLVSFTGYACTNCHWMKANMFTRPEIAAAMNDFVPVELYTDGTDAASEENQKLQESRFRTVAIPYYAILTPDEKVVATFPGLTRDPVEFLAFLKTR
ncbi:MAG: protein-disulfide reductase DsbD family protein [Rhodospirillales bacterium]